MKANLILSASGAGIIKAEEMRQTQPVAVNQGFL